MPTCTFRHRHKRSHLINTLFLRAYDNSNFWSLASMNQLEYSDLSWMGASTDGWSTSVRWMLVPSLPPQKSPIHRWNSHFACWSIGRSSWNWSTVAVSDLEFHGFKSNAAGCQTYLDLLKPPVAINSRGGQFHLRSFMRCLHCCSLFIYKGKATGLHSVISWVEIDWRMLESCGDLAKKSMVGRRRHRPHQVNLQWWSRMSSSIGDWSDVWTEKKLS